jgi:hypothetical protein
MYIAVVGKLKESEAKTPHKAFFIGSDQAVLIQQALKTKKEWESRIRYGGIPYGPYDIFIGELTQSVEPVAPIVDYKLVRL